MDLAFISGTSIKVLGAKKINNYNFDPENEILKKISSALDDEIENDINNLA